MQFAAVSTPRWRSHLPHVEQVRRLRDDIDSWISSAPLEALASEWGGSPPAATPEQRLDWFDRFSAIHWDFRRGRERNLAMNPDDLTPAREQLALEVARALGMVEPRSPAQRDYDFCLVLGGLVRACVVRPAFAKELISRGIAFGSIVALGGFRPLLGDELDLATALGVSSSNEFGAMISGVRKYLVSEGDSLEVETSGGETNSDWAVASFGSSPPATVVAAASSDPDTRRANSADSYVWWAKRINLWPSAKILIVTAPIYVPYQGAGAIEVLGLGYGADVETIGVTEDVADLGEYTQRFAPANYLQEIRSAIRGYRSLIESVT